MTLRQLALDMRVPVSDIELIAQTASYRYKTYHIAKRTGGTREISHPAKELKSLQRWLAGEVFSKLPVHQSVYSYRRGVGIRDHAELHRKQNYLLRIDFQDFFPSITTKDVARLLVENRRRLSPLLSPEDFRNVCRIVCRYGRLTIGAPSSPIISNAILYSFDRHWFSVCKKREIVYSRYADDIYFSTDIPNILAATLDQVRDDLRNRKSPRLQINQQKVVFTSRKYNRNVTGLVLTSDKRISIGHQRKRWIRSQVHRFLLGQLSEGEAAYLRGYLSFVRSVEPTFLSALRKKYGADAIRRISNSELITGKTGRT